MSGERREREGRENAKDMYECRRLNGIVKKETDRLSVVCATDGLGQCTGNVNGIQLGADLLLVLVRDSVCNNNLSQNTVVNDLDSLAAENTMCDNGIDLDGTVLSKGLGGQSEGTASISHIIDQDGDLSLDISNQHHPGNLVGLLTLLVDQSKVQVEAISNRSSSKRGVNGCKSRSIVRIGQSEGNVL